MMAIGFAAVGAVGAVASGVAALSQAVIPYAAANPILAEKFMSTWVAFAEGFLGSVFNNPALMFH